MNNPTALPAEGYPRRWLALSILLLASFMNLIDVSIVNVALPSMQHGLKATSSQLEWVVAAYVLSLAILLLPLGRLGDIAGRKGIFLAGVLFFTAASGLCGVAPNIDALIWSRVLQGMAAAAMTPQVMAIVGSMFPLKERAFAYSFFALTAGLAAVAGPVAGGLLMHWDLGQLGWRAIFLVNIPIGLLTFVSAVSVVPRVEPHPGLRNDLVGIVIFAVSILAIVFPLVEGRTYGWPAWSFALMAGGVAGLYGFYLWERRRHAQRLPELVPLPLLESRNFVVGTAMTLLFFSGIPGLFMILAIFLQVGYGLTPLQSGLTTVPFPLGVLVASVMVGRLRDRLLSARVAAGSLLLAAGSALLIHNLQSVGSSVNWGAFALPLLIAGTGLGVAVTALFQSILQGVPQKDAGSGSGSLQAFQQVGGALGVAIMGHLFFSSFELDPTAHPGASTPMFLNAASNALWYDVAVFLIVAALVRSLRATKPGASSQPDMAKT